MLPAFKNRIVIGIRHRRRSWLRIALSRRHWSQSRIVVNWIDVDVLPVVLLIWSENGRLFSQNNSRVGRIIEGLVSVKEAFSPIVVQVLVHDSVSSLLVDLLGHVFERTQKLIAASFGKPYLHRRNLG